MPPWPLMCADYTDAMPSKPVLQALPIQSAMDQSGPLARLMQRLHESSQRFEAVRERLPPALRTHVRPGPLDESGWSLLAANTAIAAKLRHLLPTLNEALAEGGWEPLPIRVKIPGHR